MSKIKYNNIDRVTVLQKSEDIVLIEKFKDDIREYNNKLNESLNSGYHILTHVEEYQLRFLNYLNTDLESILYSELFEDSREQFIEIVIDDITDICSEVIFMKRYDEEELLVVCKENKDSSQEFEIRLNQFKKQGYAIVFSVNKEQIRDIKLLYRIGKSYKYILQELFTETYTIV